MKISAVNFCGNINNKYDAAASKYRNLFGLTSDTCSFSSKKTSRSEEEVLEKAKSLKEETDDSYREYDSETTLAPTDIQCLHYDPNEDIDYVTFKELKDAEGKTVGKTAVYKDGQLSKIKIYKMQGSTFLGVEKYYFDKDTGELKQYKAKTKEGYFKGIPINVSNITETEYDF